MNNKRILIVSSIVCIIPAVAGLMLFSLLPDTMPIQWGTGGQVTNYAPKWFALFGMPVFLMLFNLFLHVKTDKTDKERHYPVVMIIFIKWVMPALSVVCTGLSVASVTGISMTSVSVTGIFGTLIVILGCLPDEAKKAVSSVLPVFASDNKGIDKFVGAILCVFGIIVILATFLGLGYYALIFAVIASGVTVLSAQRML